MGGWLRRLAVYKRSRREPGWQLHDVQPSVPRPELSDQRIVRRALLDPSSMEELHHLKKNARYFKRQIGSAKSSQFVTGRGGYYDDNPWRSDRGLKYPPYVKRGWEDNAININNAIQITDIDWQEESYYNGTGNEDPRLANRGPILYLSTKEELREDQRIADDLGRIKWVVVDTHQTDSWGKTDTLRGFETWSPWVMVAIIKNIRKRVDDQYIKLKRRYKNAELPSEAGSSPKWNFLSSYKWSALVKEAINEVMWAVFDLQSGQGSTWYAATYVDPERLRQLPQWPIQQAETNWEWQAVCHIQHRAGRKGRNNNTLWQYHAKYKYTDVETDENYYEHIMRPEWVSGMARNINIKQWNRLLETWKNHNGPPLFTYKNNDEIANTEIEID